jgi:hypothetical protein
LRAAKYETLVADYKASVFAQAAEYAKDEERRGFSLIVESSLREPPQYVDTDRYPGTSIYIPLLDIDPYATDLSPQARSALTSAGREAAQNVLESARPSSRFRERRRRSRSS